MDLASKGFKGLGFRGASSRVRPRGLATFSYLSREQDGRFVLTSLQLHWGGVVVR